MALGQVSARMEGDYYQSLFFWYYAAKLLIPGSMVNEVSFEVDEAPGVDDISINYQPPGVAAGGYYVTHDYFQIKYHVDNRSVYSSDALINPDFINSKSSILQKFYHAYSKLSGDHSQFRLNLVSNWIWAEIDYLGKYIRDDGRLPDAFYQDDIPSQLEDIRDSWKNHLQLPDDLFFAFMKTLRIQTNFLGNSAFQELVYATLRNAGLKCPQAHQYVNPYASLYQECIKDQNNHFDAHKLRELLIHEDLIDTSAPIKSQRVPTLGLRSFMRFAENIEEEADEFMCVAEYFDGRCPRDDTSWVKAADRIVEFLGDRNRRSRVRQQDHALLLECLGTFAFLAGYELSRNSGARVYPIHKLDHSLWRLTSTHTDSFGGWRSSVIPINTNGNDIAIAVSVTNDIVDQVECYLKSGDGSLVRTLITLCPATGIGHRSIQGPEHAQELAEDLVSVIRSNKPTVTGFVHLFFSAPNTLLFYVGQFREALGRIVLYEFDFGLERHCTYERSLILPYRR